MEKLVELAGLIADDGLREKVLAFLRDPPTDLDQPALPVGVCPAGAYQHHSYRGGLVEHTLSVVTLCMSLCDVVEEQYGGRVDRDLVLAGAILHDIMKVYCYEETGGGGFRTSEFGGLVDHLSLIIAEMYKRGLPLDLVHVVAGHHGDAGPTKPKTLEALIVSVADQADSDLNGKLLHAAEYLLRRSGVSKPVLGSAKEALDVVQVKSREGWEGLQRMLGDDG
ncbi:HD domain-containing protein [Candidatus Bathyarchaeota archaeon]|nr:HD domain-containing protein [Candidatus Bathyarchaeota archaeon]